MTYTKTELKLRMALLAATLRDESVEASGYYSNDYAHSAPYLSYETGIPYPTVSRVLRKLHAQGDLSRKYLDVGSAGRQAYGYWFTMGGHPPVLCENCGHRIAHPVSEKVSEPRLSTA